MGDVNVKPKKELGQNFLVCEDVLQRFVNQLNIGLNYEIIEVGPGLGAITQKLIKKIGPTNFLLSVEYDPRMIPGLNELSENNNNIQVIQQNILDWLPTHKPVREYVVVGSLPYYITSPILHTVISLEELPEECVFVVQKEVAEKICAEIPKSNYLSSYIQTFFNARLIEIIDKECFEPIPKVDGAMIKLKKRHSIPIGHEEKSKYEGFLHRAYSNPRKMLNKVFSEDELARVNIKSNLRPQNISVEQWIHMFKNLV
jgi:16S rRNA (adenine1518-N6/adenine1519-N6)-dimethyltransferase